MRSSIWDILVHWPYDPEGLAIRLIDGEDGREKLQIRLDLGLLQLELDGRPDGQQPHGFPSLYEYHLDRLEAHRERYGNVEGFQLDAAECAALREEASMVYQRYFSLYHIDRFAEVARDTSRNLTVLDFLHRHGASDEDRTELEQFRPYITMMNALSRIELRLVEHDYQGAERILAVALAAVRSFAAQHSGTYDCDREIEVLSERLAELNAQRPSSEAELLQRRLDEAVAQEDFETAASLRDQLARLLDNQLPPVWD